MDPISAGIMGGASIYGAINTAQMNKKTRKWNEKMYAQQRKDNLTDWATQNQYNSPAAQMQRLKEAGLNPNLVYGNGVDGNSTAPAKSADVKGWDPKNPDIGSAAPAALAAFQNMRQSTLQADLVKQQIELAKADTDIKKTTQLAQKLNIADKTFDLDFKKELKDTNLDYKRELLRNIMQKFDQNVRSSDIELGRFNLEKEKWGQTQQNLMQQIRASEAGTKLTLAQTSKINSEIQNIQKAGKLQDFEIKMQELLSNVGGSTPAGMLFKIIMGLAGKYK